MKWGLRMLTCDWSALSTELALWRRAHLALRIWWRDDDAVAHTPELDHLMRVGEDVGLPVHLAVIPDQIEASLAPVIEAQAQLIPIIHGWRHVNHAPQGAKNAEFGHPRAGASEELVQALAKMQSAFGAQLLPMFVPPWNRIDPVLLPVLAHAGYVGVSTYGARTAPFAAVGLVRINTHIDPIFWRGDRGLVDPQTLISGIVNTLRDRREGRTDAQEPLGLLTHHLVHDPAIWAFCSDVLRVLLDGGARPADIATALQAGRNPNI